MRLLSSNFEPLMGGTETFISRWEKLFQNSNSIKIGVGYASNDSLLYLKKLIELNEPKHLEICLGMAFFDGITISQFDAMKELNIFLKSSTTGKLSVSRTFPFHGKIHFFESKTKKNSFLLGSSNLSNIVPIKGVQRRNYEVDLEVDDVNLCKEVESMLEDLFNNCSTDFDSVSQFLNVIENPNALLVSRTNVESVGNEKLQKILKNLSSNIIRIPLKDTPKSNLNVYFGEGRVSKQGFIKPRHWYEVEIIVDQSIQQSSIEYPANQDFVAYTDDGLRFLMRTSGDYGKNLRSKDDLTILGRWIKGRMEASGALKSGEQINASTFVSYGRDTITLTQSRLFETDPENGELPVWYLDFGVREKAIKN